MEIIDGKVIEAFVTGLFGLITGVVTTCIKQKFSKKKTTKKTNPKNLLINHHIFNRLDIVSTQVQQAFTLRNKGKEAVFKDIIVNQINIYINNLKNLAKDVDSGHIQTNDHLYNATLKYMDRINKSLHSYYVNNINYTIEDQHVLDIVMSKYEKWNVSHNQYILENISICCNSPFYNTIQIKASVILDIYLTCAVEIINSAQKTLDSLNGDLKGLVFKGVKM